MSIALRIGNTTATASRGGIHIDMKGTASPPSASASPALEMPVSRMARR
ncbi:MAG: hypothetical protein BWZ09_01328 [Alphaproteobacteria bacterium ADurb.BinA305]|jgi:hypothetical protein|nr:MAG: hypothetical protein BWZ09_01328 [Alphaproteobacteria bacterium ADurb.BinA305]